MKNYLLKGESFNGAKISIDFLKILILPLILFSNIASAHFGSKGPFGGSASVGIAYDSTIYLGTFAGGVFQSANTKLAGWSAKPVGLKSGKITALAHTGKYLFAGTADSGVFIFNGFVKTDKYWLKKNKGLSNLKITSLVAVDSITLFVGTDGGGIFKTTDRGENWVPVNNADLHHLQITGLVKAGNRIIHISLDGGIYASDDLGSSWINVNDDNTNDIDGTTAISYNQKTGEVLLFNSAGLFKASSAATASKLEFNLAENGLPADIEIRSISNDGDNWYLATNKGVYISSSASVNWVAINSGLSTMDVTTVVSFRDKLICGTKGEGVFKIALPATTNWLPINTGFNNLATYSFATSGVAVIAVATEKGVFVSRDLATNYSKANKGLTDSLHVNDLAFAGTHLLAATKNGGVFISADTGLTWTTINNGLESLTIRKVFYSNSVKYAIDINGKVYSSQVLSDTWTLIQNGLPVGVKPTSMAFFSNKILLGTSESGVFVKTAAGDTWTQSNTGLSNLTVTSVTSHKGKIYAGTSGSGVFVSDTAAINWNAASKTFIEHTSIIGLNGDYIQAIASYGDFVYASYKGGLIASADNGHTWVPGGNQFNLPSFTDVNKIDFVTTRVFVTTENNGLYSNALTEVVTQIVHKQYVAENGFTISPNPGKGMFTYSSAIPVTQISIYDQSGRLVKVSEGLSGELNVDLPSGIYFVIGLTKEGALSEKLIIE